MNPSFYIPNSHWKLRYKTRPYLKNGLQNGVLTVCAHNIILFWAAIGIKFRPSCENVQFKRIDTNLSVLQHSQTTENDLWYIFFTYLVKFWIPYSRENKQCLFKTHAVFGRAYFWAFSKFILYFGQFQCIQGMFMAQIYL